MKNLGFIGLILALLFSNFNIPTGQIKQLIPVTASAPLTPEVQIIVTSMDGMSKEDATKLYSICSGLSLYIGQTTRVDNTVKLDKILSQVRDDFGFTKEKYPKYSDAVEKFLTSKGYTDPKKIVDSASGDKEVSRADVVAYIKVLADAAKVVKDASK